ncbi:MAG: hypothetical protein D6772_03980 [Bacteroidetes bacterium]|nr:MAG: hypothetical protein D6772_03980 [Bacteroidota bacterium]
MAKGLVLMLVAGIPYYLLLKAKIEQHDPLYYKATYHSPYLVIGASRAQKGIAPQVLEEELSLNAKALNFAFNGITSPYGKPYFELIKRKLGKIDTKGLFILSVNPLTVMDYELGRGRREEDFRFYDLYLLNSKPNPEYILRNIGNQRCLMALLLSAGQKARKYDVLHDNGWVERNPPPHRRPQTLAELSPGQLKPLPSPNRERWLRRTVQYLQQYGQVVLVRMPTKDLVRQEEARVLPHFQTFLQQLARDAQIPYFDYASLADSLTYLDNFHHLDGPGARAFTKRLAQDIKAAGYW